MSDIALIQYYYQEWTSYTRGANYVSRLFTYLNRYWVKREKDEGRKGVYPVYIVRFDAALRVRRELTVMMRFL